MRLVSFDGVTFTTLGLTQPGFDNPASPGPQRGQGEYPRIGANPAVGAVETGTQVLTATFTPATGQSTETTLLKLFAVLNPDNPEPRTLVAELEDGTDIETQAQPGNWRYTNVNTAAVDFTITTPGWYAQADTTLKSAGLVSATGTIGNGNTGYRDMLPDITVYWDGTQRASTTADFGWKHRIGTGTTITNNGTDTLHNIPYQIGPVNTRALVTAGQLQADGDDLRVFCEGQELRRNVIGINTRYTFIWVILPDIAPGETVTLDLVINNSSATSPPTLTTTSTPRLPAMDISGVKFNPTAATSTTVTTSGQENHQWVGGTMFVDNAAGTGAAGQIRYIASGTPTVIGVNRAFTTTPALTDDIIIVRSGVIGDGGATTSSTASTLVDGSAAWGTYDNALVGATIHIVSGTGSGQTRTITAVNEATDTLTVSPNWSTNPGAASVYRIYKPNGVQMWDVRNGDAAYDHGTGHTGLWFTNKVQAPPSVVDFDAPGSWYRFVYEDNKDSYSQPRFVSRLVGAGDYDHNPIVQIQRSRNGKTGQHRELGVADSVGYYTPFPIVGFRMSMAMRNAKLAGSSPAEGMCEARVMVQEAGGETWSTIWSDNAVYSSTTLVTPADDELATYSAPNRIALTLVPNGGDEIPKSDNNTALFETFEGATQPLSLWVTPGSTITESVDWWTATPAVVAVYDIHLRLNTDGSSPVPPYYQIDIGGIDRRVFISATDERIFVDCEKQTVSLTTDAGVYIRSIPYCVSAVQVVDDPLDGSDTEMIAARWLPIPSVTLDTAVIRYQDPSGAGWGSVGLAMTGRRGYWT
jgi:hypothetical protein